jgi:DNA-directed RNA polymerase specialized sigma24 family protein
MPTRNVSKQASALAKARERRRALDKERDDQDKRIEEATAGAFIALEVRADAESALESATRKLGEALKLLLAEDVTIEKAAALLELEATDVRRLVRNASSDAIAANAPLQPGAAAASALPDEITNRGAVRAG